MPTIDPTRLIPCKQPNIGPNGEGQKVPHIRLAVEAGLALLGTACLFRGKRLLGSALATLGVATALGEIRVIRNLPSAPRPVPPHLYDRSEVE